MIITIVYMVNRPPWKHIVTKGTMFILVLVHRNWACSVFSITPFEYSVYVYLAVPNYIPYCKHRIQQLAQNSVEKSNSPIH